MIKVLFVCLGNICRSPMGEFVLKDMIEKRGLQQEFYVASAGTSNEEQGNPVHPKTVAELARHGITCRGKYAVQLRKEDYDQYDYVLAMESWNITQILRIFGKDPKGKVHRLLDFTSHPRDIADPWYSHNFQQTYEDVLEGCQGFLQQVAPNTRPSKN